MSAQKRSYTVFVDVLTTHQFEVEEANSPEEAEAIVDSWLDDGEDGEVSEREVLESTAYANQEGHN